MLLHEVCDFGAAAAPDAPALLADGASWDFAALAHHVRTAAAGISALAAPGERVVVVSENSAAFVAALYAVPRAGAVLCMGNTRHTPAEIAATVARCGATVLLASPGHLARLAGEDLPTVRHRLDVADLLEPLAGPGGSAHGGDTTGGDGVVGRDGVVDAHDTAWLLYTSGTTGPAKGAMLTHRSVIAAVLNTSMARPVAADEVYLFPFPLFHVAAYNVVHHHLRRRPVVLLPRFEPLAVLSAIEDHRVTSVSLAPTMLAMLLDHPDRERFDLSSLRTVSYGAAAMPLDTLRRSLAEWPQVGLAQGYGMTELSGNAVFLPPEDHRRAAASEPDLLSAAGRPAPLVALRIVDQAGGDVAPGGVGEILVKGDQVCAGYWDDPVGTAAAMGDGWLRTGDMGRIDRSGRLHVVDRLKDIIITGGENVASREVEDALGTHPGVAAVAVVGTPHDTWGEQVVAVVVPADPAAPPALADLRASCAGLAGFKHPRRVEVVGELPTNASGKVDKVALRRALTPET